MEYDVESTNTTPAVTDKPDPEPALADDTSVPATDNPVSTTVTPSPEKK
jgi:hypothetical protein